MSTTAPAEAPPATASKAGKYLTFAMAAEKYGIPILRVREIVGIMPITAVPHVPSYYRGVINLRGQVIPVLDLRAKFSMEPAQRTEQACIVITEIRHGTRRANVGVIVDRVLDVLNIGAQQIDEPPSFGEDVATEFILGIAKVGDGITILLDIERVLASADVLGLPGVPDASPSTTR